MRHLWSNMHRLSFVLLVWGAFARGAVRPEFNLKLSQMAPKSGSSSSTGFTWVPVPTNAAQQNPLMYTYPFGYVTAQDQLDNEHSVTQILADNTKPFDSVQPVASVTSYAYVPNGGASALTGTGMSGYGADMSSNASSSLSFSAVGLLGFLFFLKLIQDTLAILRGGNNVSSVGKVGDGKVILDEPIGGRRSRATFSFDHMEWIKMADDMYHFYLQVKEEKNSVCRQKSLCQFNTYLAHKYKDAGKKMGFLLSDVVGETLKNNGTDDAAGVNSQECVLYSHFCSSNGRTRTRFRY